MSEETSPTAQPTTDLKKKNKAYAKLWETSVMTRTIQCKMVHTDIKGQPLILPPGNTVFATKDAERAFHPSP